LPYPRFLTTFEKLISSYAIFQTLSSRINSILSLSRIKTLTLDFTSSLFSYPTSLNLHSSRLVSSTPLSLTKLTILLEQHHRPFLSPLHDSLFPLLNPTSLSFNFQNRFPNDDPFFIVNSFDPSSTTSFEWTQVATVELSGGIPLTWRDVRWQLAAVSPPSPRQEGGTSSNKRTLRLHLASLVERNTSATLRKVLEKHTMFGLEEMEEGEVVLVVGSEMEKWKAERALLRVEVGRRSLFSVKMEL